MAIAESRRERVPDRLLIALLHAGVAPETLLQCYTVSVDELDVLTGRPREPLLPEDLERVPDDGCLYELWKGELIRIWPGKIRHGGMPANWRSSGAPTWTPTVWAAFT